MTTDPDETARQVRQFMSERDRFARRLGIELTELRPGFSRAEMTLTPDMVNGLGIPHGAAIFSLADFSFAAACNSHGTTAVALSMDIHFLTSPEPGSHLISEGLEVQRGARTGLYRMTVEDVRGRLVAESHGMAYFKKARFLTAAAPPGNGKNDS